MSGITYEELPRLEQEVYDKRNKRRRIFLFIEWAVAAAAFVFGFILSFSEDKNPLSGILVGLFSGLLFGGVISGLEHLGFLFKKAVKHGILLIIILGIYYLMVFGAICMLAYLSGWVFLIIDSIKFIIKKPLVSQREITRVLNS